MGIFDFNPLRFNSKPIKAKPIKLPTFHTTRQGERTLTSAQKRKLKEEAGFKCERCGGKFKEEYLQIHHKKSIASHKNPIINVSLPIHTMGEKYIPAYDRIKSNLEVVCITCHNKTKHGKKKTSLFYSAGY